MNVTCSHVDFELLDNLMVTFESDHYPILNNDADQMFPMHLHQGSILERSEVFLEVWAQLLKLANNIPQGDLAFDRPAILNNNMD